MFEDGEGVFGGETANEERKGGREVFERGRVHEGRRDEDCEGLAVHEEVRERRNGAILQCLHSV